jgi:outer membrane protein OmpA-like peptidoglycan-associated protein
MEDGMKISPRVRRFAAGVLFAICAAGLWAETFRFKYRTGDTYRILNTIKESVSVNNQFDHRAEIVNRISVEVVSAEGGEGKHDAVFMTAERSVGASGESLVWGDEYRSVFSRDAKGRYTIDDAYFMPVVRNVPIFPDGDVKSGATWTAEGEEAHDLRRTFGIGKPFKIPFTASYKYAGTVTTKEGRVLHIINAKYNIRFQSPPRSQTPQTAPSPAELPLMTQIFSDQTLYFDAERGLIERYTETFKIAIETDKGNLYEFEGTSEGEVTEYETTAAERIGEVQKEIDTMTLNNVDVVAEERGLTLRIENIQFLADSAVLMESEKAKLRSLAEILSQFPDNDLLVSGHTAVAGTSQGQQKLSEERARAVADYLVSLGVRDTYHVFTRGFGATKPIAPNTTPSGMEKNRRVEITILNK